LGEQTQQPTILIVDDEEDLLEICRLFFEETYEYRVLTSNISTNVEEIIEANPVQTVILDINLPERSGIEVLEGIREIEEKLPVIFISAYTSLETAVSALRYGAYDYLKKPFKLRRLGKLVERAMEKYRLELENEDLKIQLEKELEHAKGFKSFYKSIISSMTSGLITIDTDKKVTDLNDAAANLFNTIPDEAKGKYLYDLWHVEEIDDTLNKALNGEVRNNKEVYMTDPKTDKQRCVGYTCSPLKNDRNEIIGAIINFKDITEVKEMTDRLRRMDRLATLGQFTASLAHEIKNPLAGIHAAADLLLEITPSDSRENKYLNLMNEELERVNNLIQSMLNYSNPKPLNLRPIYIEDIIHNIIDLNNELLKRKNIDLKTDYAHDKRVLVDRDQIKQIFLNLIINAIDALDDGGKIRLKTRLNSDGDFLIISVSDNGLGISPEHQEKIFQPFFTKKSNGFGLGLPTVERIIHEHGGEISVESELGKGTTFHVSLPVDKETI
jgi:PAS domain S-box-containing protein